MLEEAFLRLSATLEELPPAAAGSEILRSLCEQFELTHIAYLGVNLPLMAETKTYIVATYSPDWIRRYEALDYVSIDPVVQTGMRGILPFDWADSIRADKKVVQLFGEAREHGVGTKGLTFPIRGALGERAWFSINTECTDAEWSSLKKARMADFQMLAYHFHTRVLHAEGCMERHASILSKSEIECLKWAAAGKTRSETAQILSRSASTIRFHLETARTKLDAVNNVQAVAKAIAMELL